MIDAVIVGLGAVALLAVAVAVLDARNRCRLTEDEREWIERTNRHAQRRIR